MHYPKEISTLYLHIYDLPHFFAYLQAEPLHYLGIRRIYSDSDVSKDDAYDILKNILKCNNTAFKGIVPRVIRYF